MSLPDREGGMVGTVTLVAGRKVAKDPLLHVPAPSESFCAFYALSRLADEVRMQLVAPPWYVHLLTAPA